MKYAKRRPKICLNFLTFFAMVEFSAIFDCSIRSNREKHRSKHRVRVARMLAVQKSYACNTTSKPGFSKLWFIGVETNVYDFIENVLANLVCSGEDFNFIFFFFFVIRVGSYGFFFSI